MSLNRIVISRSPFEQAGVAVELMGQLGGEELLELDPPSRGLCFALGPACETGLDRGGKHLDQLRLERSNRELQSPWFQEPSPIDDADHLAVVVQDRRGHHGGVISSRLADAESSARSW